MDYSALQKLLYKTKIIPVITLYQAEDAFKIGEILTKNNFPIVEITFRSTASIKAIEILRDNYPHLIIAAGTVLSAKDVSAAKKAGASFIVSPGFNPNTVEASIDNELLIIPGVNSPTNIEMALEYDLSLLKFFPAEASGGITMLKALSGPYPMISLIPTGGITPMNIEEYLALKNITACGLSWMSDEKLLKNRQFETINARFQKIQKLLRKD